MKHTPGPWEIWELQDRDYSVEIASVEAGCTVGAAYHINDDPVTPCEETMANARLIASAPELLEALQIAAGFIESGESCGYDFFEVRAAWRRAFAKAEGVTE